MIEFTDFINGDNDILFFASFFKTALRIGGVQSDKSYIADVEVLPDQYRNKNCKNLQQDSSSFSGAGHSPQGPAGNATFELNSSHGAAAQSAHAAQIL